MDDFERVTERAAVRPIKFYQKFVPNDDGSLRSVDWVEYAAIGNAKYQTVPDAIARVSKLTDGTWECIKPAYEAWKKGQDAPVNGTPFAAWSGITPEQAEVLKACDIRSVEEVALMNDHQMRKCGIPNIRWLRDQAIAFADSKDTRAIEVAMAKKDEEIELLKQQMSDLMAMVQPPADQDDGGETPKRRGRPPKVQSEAA